MKLVLNLLILTLITPMIFGAQIVLQNPKVNELAPTFSSMDSNGSVVKLSDFVGTPVILEWTNHDCPYVARHYEENNMQTAQKIAHDKGFIWLSVISSTPGDQGHVSPKKANELSLTRNAYPTHVLLDESGDIGMMYGAKTTPHMYIIDAQGILRYKGAIDDIGSGMKFFKTSFADATNYINTQLDDVIQGNSLKVVSTVAYGCSVKYNYD